MKAYELNGLSRAPWGQGFDSVDADTLMNSPLPQSQFLVEGLISQGVHILCGASKIGKSWLMLDLAPKKTNKARLLTFKKADAATEVTTDMLYIGNPVTAVTLVTDEVALLCVFGSASTGFVYTNPLVRAVSPAGSVGAVESSRFQRYPLETRTPETPGGDANG